MFNFKKEDRTKAEQQYAELLESVGKKNKNNKDFVLGEQKDIYDKGLSLDDIISKSEE